MSISRFLSTSRLRLDPHGTAAACLAGARRAQAVLLLLKKEVELCKLQQDIREQVRGVLRRLRARSARS